MITKALKIFYSAVFVIITLFICRELTQEGLQLWYNQTPKTSITPPNYIFPVAWGILYILLGVYFYLLLAWRKLKDSWKAHVLFVFQLVLQIVWCLFFFALGKLAIGLIILLIADFATVALIRATKDLNLNIYYLLWPYLVWMLYATLINLSYVYQNGSLVMF